MRDNGIVVWFVFDVFEDVVDGVRVGFGVFIKLTLNPFIVQDSLN